MDKKALKKEFKNKCKMEKSKSYRYSTTGAIVVVIGLIILLVSILLAVNGILQYPIQIVGFAIGGILGLIGAILDGIGEITFSKEFKQYLNSKE